jgi:hypothetical protein
MRDVDHGADNQRQPVARQANEKQCICIFMQIMYLTDSNTKKYFDTYVLSKKNCILM